MARRQQSPGHTQNVRIDGSGNIVTTAAGDNNTVTVTVDNFEIEKVRDIAAAVRQTRDALKLPPEADNLLEIVEQSNECGSVHRAAHELYLLLSATTTGAKGSLLAPQLGQLLGIS